MCHCSLICVFSEHMADVNHQPLCGSELQQIFQHLRPDVSSSAPSFLQPVIIKTSAFDSLRSKLQQQQQHSHALFSTQSWVATLFNSVPGLLSPQLQQREGRAVHLMLSFKTQGSRSNGRSWIIYKELQVRDGDLTRTQCDPLSAGCHEASSG